MSAHTLQWVSICKHSPSKELKIHPFCQQFMEIKMKIKLIKWYYLDVNVNSLPRVALKGWFLCSGNNFGKDSDIKGQIQIKVISLFYN